MSNVWTDHRTPDKQHSLPTHEYRDEPRACKITLRGRVQGLGVRPAIARLARQLQVTGSVSNSHRGVSIHIEGPSSRVTMFWERLQVSLPMGAVIETIDSEDCEFLGDSQFRIVPSTSEGPLRVQVPPDVAVCRDCLSEGIAPGNRRRGYLFTTCTDCGPRYSLLETMPYDRAGTGMSRFTMCASCHDEYVNESDRRFHSQTNCCEVCGPHAWLSEGAGRITFRGEQAIDSAAKSLQAGKIVALRGVGGYQLMVDATSESAVRELRRRKHRHGKPLAVMDGVRSALAMCDEMERRAICGPANPIVVLRRSAGAELAPSISAGLDTVGLMLPTTPLHDGLIRAVGRPLVVTSGNLEGEPLAFDQAEAERELMGVADIWLHHNRPIARPIDESVVQVMAGRVTTIRLARGLAPLPLNVASRHRILALGGHQKAAIALSNGSQAILGPHVGDLDTETSRRRYIDHIAAMQQLYRFKPALLVHDEHPDYFSTRWGSQQPVPSMAVQHHHAHIVAAMIEQGWLDRQVLGVAWDGTGYGPDRTIWGGEFLAATATGYRRVAHLLPFSLPGGEIAVRQPWRTAVAVVCETLGPQAAAALTFEGVSEGMSAQIAHVVQRSNLSPSRPLCPRTSSAGRLFDAVAAIALDATHAQFEGQAAMLLESACDLAATGEYELRYDSARPDILDWRPLLRGVLDDRRSGVSPGVIAMRFHRALASGIALVARQFPDLPVALGGGCFNNRVLTELVVERVALNQRKIATPGFIPAGDGGLAAGQLAVAAARLKGGWRPCA